MSRPALVGISIIIAIMPSFVVRSRADEMTDMLAPQYLYMELCKDSPSLPPDRLRTIDTMAEMVDKEELKKSVIKMMFTLKLAGDKGKTAAFCSSMATIIKNEAGHEK